MVEKRSSTAPCDKFYRYPYEMVESFEEFRNDKGEVYIIIEECTACHEFHHIFYDGSESYNAK